MSSDQRDSSDERDFKFGVVLLAAGKSARMGQPKLLLPWAGTTVLDHLLAQWSKLQALQLLIVTSPDATKIQAELDRIGAPASDRIENPSPERGMFSSIQCAARWSGWKPELTHWAITLGDQPHVSGETLRMLLRFVASNRDKICQPMRGGHRRHPVILPRLAFERLGDSATHDLKEFLSARPDALAGFESEDAGLDLDLDTLEDYERALKLIPPV